MPPGVHEASWDEFVERFGSTEHRRRLLDGLLAALRVLRAAGCRTVFVNGSFVTKAEVPLDYDACWDSVGVNPDLLDPVLLQFDRARAAQKAKYQGEFFPAQMEESHSKNPFIEFFQTDKNTGNRKGIVALDLRRLNK